ncbi:MAG: asparaginase [Eggerthellales bacterium]|nr:asparaginase [Eggerthellales bacterium]
MSNKKRILILATGGTIAGVGAAGKSTGYASGQLGVEDLLAAAPEIAEVADIETMQVCNINSDDITAEIWIKLARTIKEQARRPEIDGFVITHGTDTMDETAFFLNLVLKTEKPVVITGSMRPSTATSADGPMNLYQAVVTAASWKSEGMGVLVVFSGRIFSARDVQKTSTHSVVSMSGGENGSCGVIRDDVVLYSTKSTKRHTTQTEFTVDGLSSLPRVNILYFSVDADPALISMAAGLSDGLVIAGAGGGEYSKLFEAELRKLTIPVVVSSRVGSGVIMSNSVPCGIAANDLPPQKAAILLRLALTETTDQAEIARMFEKY